MDSEVAPKPVSEFVVLSFERLESLDPMIDCHAEGIGHILLFCTVNVQVMIDLVNPAVAAFL